MCHDSTASVLDELDNLFIGFLQYVFGWKEDNAEILSKARIQGDAITHLVKESRTKHIGRVENGRTSPLKSLIFTDMLNSYRRIKDHTLNIAEALAGEK